MFDSKVQGLLFPGDVRVAPNNSIYVMHAGRSVWTMRFTAEGEADPTFSANFLGQDRGPNGNVNDATVLSDGKVVAVGAFSKFHGQIRPGVARLLVDGALDPTFEPKLNAGASVRIVAAHPDGRIVIVGDFTTVDGIARPGFARLNSDGSLDATFRAPTVDGFFGWDLVVPLPSGQVFIGNQIYSVAGKARNGIALIENDGALSTSFVPDPPRLGNAQFPIVNWLHPLPDGRMFIGGGFSSVSGVGRTNIARLLPDGHLDPTFNAGPIEGGRFHSILYAAPERSGKLVVVGSFLRVNGQPRTGVARLLDDGRLDPSYISGLPEFYVITDARLASDDTLVVTGYANPPSGSTFHFVAKLAGGDSAEVPPTIVVRPESLSVRVGQNATLRVTAASALPISYQWYLNGAPVAGQTNAILNLTNVQVAQAGAYFAELSNAAGKVVTSTVVMIVRPLLTGSGYGDSSFQIGTGVNDGGYIFEGGVKAMAFSPDGGVVLGGEFNTYNGAPRGGLARISNDGQLDPSFDPRGGVNGRIHALLVQPDGKVVAGGGFSRLAGQIRSNLFRLNPDGTLDTSFKIGTGPSAPVWALARQPDGRILVGGQYRNFDGKSLSGLVRLHPDGRLDESFANGTVVNGLVRTIALQNGGHIWIGGNFNTVASFSRGGIARLLPDGRVDQSFNPGWGMGSYITGQVLNEYAVNAILPLPDGRVYVGGNFTRADDERRLGLVRFLANGVVDPGFVTFGGEISPYSSGQVRALFRQEDGRLIVTGDLSSANGVRCRLLARINDDGSLDPSFLPKPTDVSLIENSIGNALLPLADGRVLVGGNFLTAGGLPRNNLARVFADPPRPEPPQITREPLNLATPATPRTTPLPSSASIEVLPDQELTLAAPVVSFEPVAYQWLLNGVNIPGATDPVLRLSSTMIDVPGTVQLLVRNSAGMALSPPVAINVVGTSLQAGAPDPNFIPPAPLGGRVFAVKRLPGGKILVAGSFISAAGVPSNLLMRLNPDGSRDDWKPGWVYQSGDVRAVDFDSEGRILVGGGFVVLHPDGTPRTGLVRLKSDGTLDASFSASLPIAERVHSLVTGADGRTVIAGDFSQVNGQARAHLARLNTDGSLDPGFNASTDGTIAKLAQQADGKLLITGTFLQVNGRPQPHLARLNPDGSLDAAFAPGGTDDEAEGLTIQPDGKILVGGPFIFAGDEFVPNLARFNPDGTVDPTFFADITGDHVRDIVVQPDGKIVITGEFTEVESRPHDGIARLNADGAVDPSFDSMLRVSFSGPVAGFKLDLEPDGNILVVGLFHSVNSSHRARVARLLGKFSAFQPPGTEPSARVVSARVGSDLRLGWPNATPWPQIWQWFRTSSGLTNLLPGATNRWLRLADVTSTNAGTYFLRTQIPALPGVNFTSAPVRVAVNPAAYRAGLPDPDSFGDLRVDGPIHALHRLQDGRLVIGGEFSSVGGLPYPGLARLNANGSVDPSFRSPPGWAGRVFRLAQDTESQLYAAGRFVLQDGSLVHLMRLQADGNLDPHFRVRLNDSGVARALWIEPDRSLWLAGQFQSVNGMLRQNLAHIDASGQVLPDGQLEFETSSRIDVLLGDAAGGLWLGGDFSAINHQSGFAGLARLTAAHELDSRVSAPPGVRGFVRDLAARAKGQVVAGGQFTSPQRGEIHGIIEFQPLESVGVASPTLPLTGGGQFISTLAVQPDGRLLVGGSFGRLELNGESFSRAGLARLHEDGLLDTAFDPAGGVQGVGDDDAPHSMLLEPDGQILIAGGFGFVGGLRRPGLARLTGNVPTASLTDRPPKFVTRNYFDTQIFEQNVLRWTNISYGDPDTEKSDLRFSLAPGAPEGMTIDETNGRLFWTPTEAQGGRSYTATVRLRDSSNPPLEITQSFQVEVLKLNSPPRWGVLGAQQAFVGQKLTVQLEALDMDNPPDVLSYWFGKGAPPGASLDVATGLFSWTPAVSDIGSHNIEVLVSDITTQPRVIPQRLLINVTQPPSQTPSLGFLLNAPGMLTLTVDNPGNALLRLEFSDDMVRWESWPDFAPMHGSSLQINLSEMEWPQRYFRLRAP